MCFRYLDNTSLFQLFDAWWILWTVFQLIVIFVCSIHDRRKYCRLRQQRTGKGCQETRFRKRVTEDDTTYWFNAADETSDKNTSSSRELHWWSTALQVSQYIQIWHVIQERLHDSDNFEVLQLRFICLFLFLFPFSTNLQFCTRFKMVDRGNLSRKII